MRFLLIAALLALFAFTIEVSAISCELKTIKIFNQKGGSLLVEDKPQLDPAVHTVSQTFDSENAYIDVDFVYQEGDSDRTIKVTVNDEQPVQSTTDRTDVSGVKTGCTNNSFQVAVSQTSNNAAFAERCVYRYVINTECDRT